MLQKDGRFRVRKEGSNMASDVPLMMPYLKFRVLECSL